MVFSVTVRTSLELDQNFGSFLNLILCRELTIKEMFIFILKYKNQKCDTRKSKNHIVYPAILRCAIETF